MKLYAGSGDCSDDFCSSTIVSRISDTAATHLAPNGCLSPAAVEQVIPHEQKRGDQAAVTNSSSSSASDTSGQWQGQEEGASQGASYHQNFRSTERPGAAHWPASRARICARRFHRPSRRSPPPRTRASPRPPRGSRSSKGRLKTWSSCPAGRSCPSLPRLLHCVGRGRRAAETRWRTLKDPQISFQHKAPVTGASHGICGLYGQAAYCAPGGR